MKRKRQPGLSTGLTILLSLLALSMILLVVLAVVLRHKGQTEDEPGEVTVHELPSPAVDITAAPTKAVVRDDSAVSADKAEKKVLNPTPELLGKPNNAGSGAFFCVTDSGDGLFYTDMDAKQLRCVSGEHYNVVQEGICRSLQEADGRIYYVCDGKAYSCAEDGSGAARIESLAAYKDLYSVYISAEYLYGYELVTGDAPEDRRGRLTAVARQDGSYMGSLTLGYEFGDGDKGLKQFAFGQNGYLYYILRSDDGIYYDPEAMDHIWRLPAGDLYAEPESVIYALDRRLSYKQLLCEGGKLYVLYENRDGNSALTMYDTENDAILADHYWPKDKFTFSEVSVMDGVLYLAVNDYAESQKVVWFLRTDDTEDAWMGRELLRLEAGWELDYLSPEHTARGKYLMYVCRDADGNMKLGYASFKDAEDQGILIE